VHLYQWLKTFSLTYNCTITGLSVSRSMSINLRTETQLRHLKKKICEICRDIFYLAKIFPVDFTGM